MPQKNRIGRNPLKALEPVTLVEAEEPALTATEETPEEKGNLLVSLNEFLRARDKDNFKKLIKTGFIEVGSEAYLIAQKVGLWTKEKKSQTDA